jgi:hypothetical protein
VVDRQRQDKPKISKVQWPDLKPPEPLRPAVAPTPPPAPTTRAGQVKAHVALPPRRFFRSLAMAVVFPFRGKGVIVLLVSAIVLAVVNTIPWCLSLPFDMILAGYACCYAFRLIDDAASGASEPADLPMYANFAEDILQPLYRVMGAAAICLAPAAVVAGIAQMTHTEPPMAVLVTLLIGGIILLPMALLSVVMFDGLHGLRPGVVLKGIARVPLHYAIVVAMFLLAPAAIAGVAIAMPRILFAWPAVISLAMMYLYMFLAHLLGRLYYCNETRLRWYEKTP